MYYPLLCSFDLETTGIDVTRDRIVTASCIDINCDTGETTDNTWLADPGIEIPEGAAAVHGISTEYARANGKNHEQVVNEVINHLYEQWAKGAAVVVYNAAYDLSMLYVLSGGRFEIRGPVIDPLVIDKGIDKYRKGGRKLVMVANHYGIDFNEDDAHDSTADCYAAARVAWTMMKRNLIDFNSENELMQAQREWKQEQHGSLAQWLASQGKTIDGDGLWPIQQQAYDAV